MLVGQSPHTIETRTIREMKLQARALVAVPALLGTMVAVFASGCNIAEEGKVSDPKYVTASVRSLSATGSTAIQPLIDRWGADYAKSHPLTVNYRPTGSGAGIDNLRHGYGAFAASDAPLRDDQLQGLPSIVQIPVSTGPVCIAYNLPGLKAPLKLSGATLAGIFSSEIISWQDAAIARENPGVGLPHQAIIVIHRSDGSGTTSILSTYLSRVSPAWQSKYGDGMTMKWPAGVSVAGSSAMTKQVLETPGSIGYMELTFARTSGLSVALIQNRAGEYVAPSPASAYAAVDAAAPLLAKDIRTPIVDPPAAAKGAYPISGITFILIPKDNTSTDGEQEALKSYLDFALTTGQDVAEELSYAKLPAPVQQAGESLLGQLTDNGKPIK
jgi:phosphate transport system substrate-binding protein